MNIQNVGKDLAQVALDSVEFKVDFKKLFDGILDTVIEKALDEVVADSSNTWDDSAKALLWPILEPKIKEILEKEAAILQSSVDGKIAAFKAKVLPA